MLVSNNPTVVQIPDGYVLVQQISSNPNTASNSNPNLHSVRTGAETRGRGRGENSLLPAEE